MAVKTFALAAAVVAVATACAPVLAGCGVDPVATSSVPVLAVDFRSGLPKDWSVQNGSLGEQVQETPDGISFPPQPPNLPKGSILLATAFQAKPGQRWLFGAVTKGVGLGSGMVDWRDADGQSLGAVPFADGESADFAEKTATLEAPVGAAAFRLWFGVDTFGSRVLRALSISSLPGS